jgi:hypothetical protein
MSFGIKSKVNSLTVLTLVEEVIEILNALEVVAFNKAQNKSEYVRTILEHPVVKAIQATRITNPIKEN